MQKKLHILQIFSNLVVEFKTKSPLTFMYNFFAKFGKIPDVCKYFSKDLVNNQGNVPRRGKKPKFSDIEVIALNITADDSGYDSECRLFNELITYQSDIPEVISRRQYNDRRKNLSELCETIRKRIANEIDGSEDHFCIDSKPILVCRISRSHRCKPGKDDIDKAITKVIVLLKVCIVMDISCTQCVV